MTETTRAVPMDETTFYEGKYATSFSYDLENPLYRTYLKYSIYRADWISFEMVRNGGEHLLDVGCGGGKSIFKKKSKRVTGLDLSSDSLRQAAKIYDAAVAGRADSMPFDDSVFDQVYSAHLLGHIPPERKEAVLRELYRVTQKGGQHVHYIETDGDNFAVHFAKKDPELYRKNFVEFHGHYGLESPSAAVERISRHFRILEVRKFNSGVFSVEGTLDLFNGYWNKSVLLRCLGFIYRLLNKASLPRRVANFLLGFIMRFHNRRTPFDQGDWIVVRCIKE